MEPKSSIHEHPLHFFEEWSNITHGETRGVDCSSGCGQPISAQFYACIDCKFNLHKSCSELPLNITHPFHDNHPLTLLAKAPYLADCDFCGNKVYGFVYHCSSCQFDLDIKCALLPKFLYGDFPKVKHHIHVEHPLFFIENLSHEVELASLRCCCVCLEQLSDASFYTCLVCKLFLHKSCSETELPLNINHPFHEKHSLTLTLLKWDSAVLCQFCHNNRYLVGLFYHCSCCRFNLDIKCAFLPQFLTGNFPKRDHHFSHVDEHPLFFIQKDLISSYQVTLFSKCFVCGKSLSTSSFYYCPECPSFSHKSCVFEELPLEFNHSLHDKHALTLKKCSPWWKRLNCNFCLSAINGFGYSCSSCEFQLDPQCALLIAKDIPKRDHHFSHVHEHPLFFIQKDLVRNNQIKLRSCCFVCKESTSGSSFYCCPECEFFLHKSCAFEELPLKINHPLHDEHALTLIKSSSQRWWERCNFCLNSMKGFRYSCSCSSCEFKLDPRCALLIPKDLPKRDHHFSHVEHPLAFVQMLSNEVEILSSCSVCSKPLLGTSFYNCPDCQFFFHKECEAELLPKIEHVAHPQHPLIPVFSAHYTCNFCHDRGSLVKKLGYICRFCVFYIHHECTLPRFFPESKIHSHQLSPFMRKNPFICDACGGGGDDARYFCLKCSIMIHKDCIFLPKLIKFKLHNHHILGHNYRLPQKEGGNWTCQFCFKKVVAEYGSYKCLHSDCNYVLHGTCVKRNKGRLYIEVESENENSDEASSSSSSCAMVLGDKIKHFGHEQELVLDKEEIIMNGDKKCCDGCASPILTAAYSCPRPHCNFSLHKACAQIGEHKPHWASQVPLRVSMTFYFCCVLCKNDCSGFSCFESEGSSICHRCSEIPFITTHEAHAQHSLFCDRDHKGQCSGCGKKMNFFGGHTGGYKCTLVEEEDCKFALDYKCLTRPLTAEHRFHHHPLKLTYQDPYKDDGDPFQHICEICEDRRDPKLWFYRCDECDFDAHPDCVLGEYKFIKRGIINNNYRCQYHDKRRLIYFQSKKYPYPKCGECGHPCKDQLALKCPYSECNYALHFPWCPNRQP